MTTPSGILLKVTKSFSPQEGTDGITYVVVKRPFAHLFREMERIFEKEQNVRVVLDGRNGDRRKRAGSAASERRRKNRRSKREAMVEIILSY